LILDDIAYVLFGLVGRRDERRSMLISASQAFGQRARCSPTPP
jgi:hypothetical protein